MRAELDSFLEVKRKGENWMLRNRISRFLMMLDDD